MDCHNSNRRNSNGNNSTGNNSNGNNSNGNNSNGNNSNGNNSNGPFSPFSQYLSFLIASADSTNGADNAGYDFLSEFLHIRRSQTRSSGSGNSPRQGGTQPIVPNPPPQSASSNRNPLSPIAGNNVRPPPLQQQSSNKENAPQKPQPSVPRGSRISPSQWEPHRAKIKELFMDNDKSLEETMKFMEVNFSFSPSRKQYSTKLKQWGFIKNISGATASWMVNKAKARKHQGLETEFTVGGQPWTMDRIERSAKRAKAEGMEASVIDVDTPPDVRYSTPDRDVSHTHKATPSERWSPSQSFHAVKPTFLHLKWNGKTKADLDYIYREAQRFARIGNFDGAEDSYLEALGGYEALLSPTHEDTIEVAYELAEFYARNDHMDDADKVIEWMGDKHIERWPIGHKRIRAHLIRVADMLHSWSRADDAISILSRAANIFEKSFQPRSTDSSMFQNLQEHAQSQSERNHYRNSRHFSREERPQQEDEDSSVRIDYDTILAIARARAKEDEAEALLLSLLEQCEKQPGKLSVQILEARGALVDLYKLLEMPDKVDEALSLIEKSFWAVFKSNAKKTKLLMYTAIEVVSLLVKADRYSEADPMLERIESDVVKVFGEDDDFTIIILIQIGSMYQTYKRWADARPRFEQALAASMTAYGLESTMTKRLEDTLEKKSYIMPVPSDEDLRQLSRVKRERCHCLGHELGYGSTAMLFFALMS